MLNSSGGGYEHYMELDNLLDSYSDLICLLASGAYDFLDVSCDRGNNFSLCSYPEDSRASKQMGEFLFIVWLAIRFGPTALDSF